MLTKEQVQHIADLARLGLTEEELEKFTKDLSRILESVSQLQEVNTDGVEPIAHITGLENAVREDDPEGAILQSTPELTVGQFPDRAGNYLKAPPILDQL